MDSYNDNSKDESDGTTNPGSVGTGDYIVGEGECFNSIAFQKGFFWKTLWDLPENQEVKLARKDPDILAIGDKITIPQLRKKEESGATEKRHRFKRKGVPARLRLRFFNHGKPRANEFYTLEVDGVKADEGTLGADGEFEKAIPPDAQYAIVRVGSGGSKTIHRLRLGTVPPVDCDMGVLRRLQNLGYSAFEDDPESQRTALSRFQADNGLVVTGKPDQATYDALAKSHGS
jgi:N-acetylmuramoyl-L-alanine amidase